MNKFLETIYDMIEIITGKRPEPECKSTICCEGDCHTEIKPKRARTKKGRYRKDDKSTPDVNEAWVGGKAPNQYKIKKKRKK
jgi:hypothetical protein